MTGIADISAIPVIFPEIHNSYADLDHIQVRYVQKKLASERKQASRKGAGNDLNILATRHEVDVASVHLALWSLFCIAHL